jgi:hypothetical protein
MRSCHVPDAAQRADQAMGYADANPRYALR